MGRCATGSVLWLACMRENSADHAESGVRKSVQRRQSRSACSEGASARTLWSENGTHTTAQPPCRCEPRPAGCARACSCQCSAAIALAGCRIPRPASRKGHGIASVRQNVDDVALGLGVIAESNLNRCSAKTRVSPEKNSGATPNRNELVNSAHADADYHPLWSRWPKNPCYFSRLAAVAALLLHGGTAASRVELFKADLILPSHRAYSASCALVLSLQCWLQHQLIRSSGCLVRASE